jgi:hypothetical protein
MNRAARRRQARMQRRVGEYIFSSTIVVVLADGSKEFYWVQTTGPEPTQADMDKFFATPHAQRNGPYATEEEADKAAELALVGPNIRIEERPGWPFVPGSGTKQ